MKTAISIPDDLFHAVESYSERTGIPRSQLYAVSEYLKAQRWRNVREALNRIYVTEDSAPDPVLEKMQRSSASRERW